jgi:transposase-like protein
METEPRKRRKFDPEFKVNALELAVKLGSVTEAANRLGVPPSRLMIWRKVMKRVEKLDNRDDRILNLEKDNEALKRTLFILLK